MRIYCYLSALDPFGNDTLQLNMDELLHVCNVKLSTAYKALAELNDRGFIQWMHVKSNVHVRPLSSSDKISTPVENILLEENPVSPSRIDSTGVENRTLKRPRRAGSSVRRSIDIRSNLLNKKREDLSTDEEFRQWITSGIDALPKPPKGDYRARLIENGLEDPDARERFLRFKEAQKLKTQTVQGSPSFSFPEENIAQLQRQRIDKLNAYIAEGRIDKAEDLICDHPDWRLALNDARTEVIEL